MVVVRVRDEHRIERPGIGRRRDVAAEVRDPVAQHGVGQQPRTAQLEQQRRVADPGDASGHARARWASTRSAMTAPPDAAMTSTIATATSHVSSAKPMPITPNSCEDEARM